MKASRAETALSRLGVLRCPLLALAVLVLLSGCASKQDEEVRKLADFFGLRYEVDPNDKTQINHSLRTAVIGPDGTVTKMFPGNEWTPAQLLAELQAANSPPQK